MLFCLAGVVPAWGQPTNLEAYQTLAVECLAAAPDTARAFRLAVPARMPFLRTALVARWQEEGHMVFLADSSFEATGALPRLAYEVEEATVAYERAGRKQLRRTVTLALRHTFTGPGGEILREDRCRDVYEDTVARRAAAGLADEAFPETQAPLPEAGWLRRYLEPVVLTAATAVAVYLFFTLRSDTSGG